MAITKRDTALLCVLVGVLFVLGGLAWRLGPTVLFIAGGWFVGYGLFFIDIDRRDRK